MRSEDNHLLTAFGWLVLLVACLVVGVTGTFRELGKLTESAYRKNNELNVAERRLAFHAADQLLTASAYFAGERGLTIVALSGPRPVGPLEMAAIRERRTLADKAFDRAQQNLSEIPRSSIRERIVARMEGARDRLVALRGDADREASKPVDERAQPVTSQSFEAPTALIGAMAELLRAIHLELRSLDRGISGWLEVQRLTWEMAEYAGRERAQIAAFLAQGGGPPRGRLVYADRHHLQAVFAWKQMQLALSSLSPPQHIIEQTKIVEQRYLTEQELVRRALVAASQHPEHRALTVPEWFQGATLAIDAMIEFGRKAGGMAAERPAANS